MATAVVLPLAANRLEPGSSRILPAIYPDASTSPVVDIDAVASTWLASFSHLLVNKDYAALQQLFLKDSYWRDHLGLTWELHTFRGASEVAASFQSHPKGCRLRSLSIDRSSAVRMPTSCVFGTAKGIQTFLNLENDVGRGRGVLRLFQDEDDRGKWKAFSLFTALEELKGHEEPVKSRRPLGVEHQTAGSKNWQERREAAENFEGELEPTVLIIGAGQGGLTTAARLRQLKVPSLIIDKNSRIGDNWRHRYHQLVLHDPVFYDHLPYLPFPDNWPIFTPKDKLAGWFESYARDMELNVWTSTTLTSATWDDKGRRWTITLERGLQDGTTSTRTLHPKHIVQATGHSGEMNFPTIKGMDSFQGSLLCHSSQFKGLMSSGAGKRAIVVGSCNSGHDIAQDYYSHGYHVTMIQRSSTCVVSSKGCCDIYLGGLYVEGGPPTEDADLLYFSYPSAVLKRLHIEATDEIRTLDAPMREGLAKVGFKIDEGPDSGGLFVKYLQRGGGYCIDVGASQMIADGKIKIKQGVEIDSVLPNGLRFADGTELPADEIVFATGYQNMRGTAKKIFGDEVFNRTKNVWGFDEEGEMRTIWRRTGHPGFWFAGGNLALCRYNSRLLALQIKGLEEGIYRYEDL